MKIKRRSRKQQRAESGFTLLETAIAGMVMLVGLLGIMQLFALSVIYNKSAKQTTLASTIAKRKIEQLIAMSIPDPSEPPPLGYGGALGMANAVTGYSENYYVDFDRNGVKGTMQIQNTPWYSGQPVSYVVTWKVEQDNITVNDPVSGLPVPEMPGLRRITVRAEATQSALVGNGVNSGANKPQAESAVLSTIRTPSQ